MHKKKIAAVTMAMILSNYSAGTMQVLANEVSNNLQLEKSNEEEASKAVVSKFDLHNIDKLDDYNKEFKIDNSKIKSISNNGGNYGSYTIDKAIDEDFSTFWETGKENSADFTSEVVITFNEITNINRIVYAARQDSAKGKGFAQNFEIYASLTEDQDDFRLVSSGEYSGSTGDIVEIQFKATEFKRLKFKFTKANQNWASASEFMFYKEDSLRDSMKELFTDSTMSQVSEEFNSADKINDLEEKVKNHTLYESFKEDIENAKALVNKKEVVYTDAKVSHFKDINSELLPAYDEIYKLSSDKIKGISNNDGRYQSETIEKAIDGDVNTKWHSGKQNTSSFTNEVVIELNETTTLNRIVYTSPRGTHRGFAQKFEIYVSTTSKGDTFELVSSGSAKETQNSVEIRFNPTEFKRVKFVFKQGYEDWACAAEFGLYTQDETVDSNELRPGTAKAGVLYTSNPYTPEEQGRMPKIRIEGAFSYPHYIKGVDNDEEVMQELSEYVEMLEEDSTLPDVFEVFSDKTLVNVRATYALDWYTKNNKLPSYTANKSDEVIRETMRFWGYDGSTELNSDFNFRYVTMLKWLDNGGFMNAGNGITGFNQGSQGGVLNVDTGWGLMHEMGHNFDTGNRTIGEVTNNILPLHFQRINGLKSKISEQNLWESKILPKVAKEDYSNNELYPENDKSLLTHLAPLWQLQLYDETFWPRFEQEFRARNIGGGSWDNIHNAWVMVASDVLQLDLVEHFARHGLYVNEETKEYTSKYEKSTKKLWYMNDNKYLNTDSEFNENLEYSVTSKLSDTNVKLTFEIDKVNANSLLGYEILRDGEIISFTASNSFTDSEITSGANHEYTVIAYDNNLNASEPYKLKIQDPVIKVDENATIALNSEFDLLDFVTARDYKGNLINDCVEVRSSNVDVTKKGTYEVEYTLTYEGVTKTAKGNVEVVSEIDYLSDMEWEAVETEYGTPRRNTNIQGRVNQIVKTFEKGFGIHANGKITYDLSDKDYDRFEALVGVDSSIAENNHSSITFKISGDGKTLATTNVIRYTDDLLYINVPVKGVNELVIEVYDGGNGNTCDHGIIANPKLITNNAKPKINASNQLLKIGEKLNLMEGVTAKDAEDGDITSKVKVS